MYILNFQRTGVDSVIDTLNLKKENLQKIKIQNFFSEEMYSLLKEIDFLNSNSSAGGGALVAFNYPLVEEKEKEFAKAFLKTAMESKDNLYYYPKPNHYTEVDDFAFFSLQKNITSENLKIESLYRQGQIRRDLRGQLHTLLRKSKNIEIESIYKKFFY